MSRAMRVPKKIEERPRLLALLVTWERGLHNAPVAGLRLDDELLRLVEVQLR